MKIVLAFILVGGMGIGGWQGYAWWKAKSQPEAPKTATAKVERGSIKLSVQATGSMASNLDVNITSKASGELIKVPFDISNVVQKGDLLMEIDPIDAQRSYDSAAAALDVSTATLNETRQNLKVAEMQLVTDTGRARAGIKSAQATLDRARVKVERLKGALAAHAATQEDYDQAVADSITAEANLDLAHVMLDDLKREEAALDVRREDIKLDEAQVRSNQVTLQLAQQHLDECKVYAPFDAVVAARNVQIGTIVSSSITNVGGGTACFVLSDLSRVFSMANVDESDIGRVRVGQTVNVTADSYPGNRFAGKVTRIATTGGSASNVVTFQVQIEILDPKKWMLKPQMTTNVEIVAAEKDDVLAVPNEALIRKKGKMYATVQKPVANAKPDAPVPTEEREVETGINDGDRSEIVKGLNEGEVVELHKGSDRWSGGNRQQTPNFNPMMGGRGPGR